MPPLTEWWQGAIYLTENVRSVGTLGIGRSGIFCTSLKRRENHNQLALRITDKRVYMSIMDFMSRTFIIVAMLVIINCTFIAYLYITYKYKTIDKFFLAWVTVSTMMLIMWFGVGLYLYFEHFL